MTNPYILAIVATIVIEITARTWHRDDLNQSIASAPVLSLPESLPPIEGISFTPARITPEQVEGLSYNRGRRFQWKSNKSAEGQRSVDLIYLEYDAGSPSAFADLFYHSPEVCMASVGELIRAERRSKDVNETTIGVRSAIFREYRSQRPIYSYKATWFSADYPVRLGVNDHLKKLQTALVRQPSPPARMIAAVLRGFESEEEAEVFFKDNVLGALRDWSQESGDRSQGTGARGGGGREAKSKPRIANSKMRRAKSQPPIANSQQRIAN